MMLDAVEKHINGTKALHAIEHRIGQSVALTREGYEVVSLDAQPDALLHAGGQSAVTRDVSSIRQNPEARLRPQYYITPK